MYVLRQDPFKYKYIYPRIGIPIMNIIRSLNLHNGNSCHSKTVMLYCDDLQVAKVTKHVKNKKISTKTKE